MAKITHKKYFAGRFESKFRGEMIDDPSDNPHTYFNIDLYRLKVIDAKFLGNSFDPDTQDSRTYWHVADVNDAEISIYSEGILLPQLYMEDIGDIRIYSYELKEVYQESGMTYGVIEGYLSACVKSEVDVPEFESEEISEVSERTHETSKGKPYSTEKREQNGTIGRVVSEGVGGCFQVFGWILGLLMLFAILFALWSIGGWLIPLLAALLLLLLLGSLLGGLGRGLLLLGRLLLALYAGLFLLGIVFAVISMFQDSGNRKQLAKDDPEERSYVSDDRVTPGDSLINHYRIWDDYNGNRYSATFSIRKIDLNKADSLRSISNYNYNSFGYSWENLYRDLYMSSKDPLDLVYQVYDSIKVANQLDSRQFAEMIVTSIQDIPYVLILEDDCETAYRSDPVVRRLVDRKMPCKGGVPLGVYAPVQFYGALEGDCDTRSLLLYTVLDHFGFEVTIFLSESYRHAMLGISIPYQGASLTEDGKRYVFWETTAKGIYPGEISPEMSNLSFWELCLTN